MRIPVWARLCALTAAVVAVMWVRSLFALGIAILVTALLFVVARLNWPSAWRQLRPILVISGLALAVNLLILGLEPAILISGRLAVALALAALFNLTTPVTEVLEAVHRALTPIIGPARSERFGLMIALVIRSVPQLSSIVREVQEARTARGMDWSLRAFAVPVMIRALKASDELGDALLARGVVD